MHAQMHVRLCVTQSYLLKIYCQKAVASERLIAWIFMDGLPLGGVWISSPSHMANYDVGTLSHLQHMQGDDTLAGTGGRACQRSLDDETI